MRIKYLARTTDRPAGDIVTEVVNAIHPDAVATMTSVHNLKRKVQHLRRGRGIQNLEVPRHKNGWEVPEELRSFLEDGGRFLQWDSGENDPNR